MPRAPVLADALLTLLRSFIKRDISAHIHIYIYIYIHIQTLAQNRTAVIKISCLATLGNYVLLVEFPSSGQLPDDGLTKMQQALRTQ